MGIKEERVLVVDPKAQAAERLLKRLSVAIKTFGLYPQHHPVAVRALEGLAAAIRPYLGTYGPFVARITKHSFVIDGVSYGGEAYHSLALHMYARKLAVITILPAVSDKELASLLSVVGMDRLGLEAAGGIEHLLWQSGVGNVQVIELTLDQEQEAEALGLNAFLALIGRGRLAPPEREAVIDILYAADHTAQLLQNVYLMCAEVFDKITPEDQTGHAYQAVRTLDRLILDEPLEGQPQLYASLAEAVLLVEESLRSALPRILIERANEDTSAKFLLTHATIDQLTEIIARAVDGVDVEKRVAGILRALALPGRKADALLSLLDARLQPPGARLGWLSDAVRPSLGEAADGREPEVPPEFVFEDGVIVINHEELAERLREAKLIDEATTLREVIMTLVDVLRNETDEEELLDLADALAGHLPWMVDHQEFALLATVLERLKRIVTAGDGGRSALAAGIVKRMTEHPLLDHLLAALWAGRDTPAEPEVRQVLGVLAGDAVLPLIRVLGGEPRAGMRAVLCDILVLIGRDHVSELGSFVHDERWYLVRNIANILGRLQSPEAVTHLERATGHPEYRVRREVADALARLGTEAAQDLLVRLLGDPDRRIQLKAVQALDAWGARRAMSKLLAILMARDPLHRHHDLKAAVLEALERLAAKEALPVLRRLAGNPLALGQRSGELRTLARRAVAAIEGQAPPDAGKRAPSVQASWGSGTHG